ncbi:MAG TPA: aminoacyl-tRNA hydrolase [Anaerolineae bacterium]|nr:aminoacyl-tRNA hydrolase [Anaerolineae bacterium]
MLAQEGLFTPLNSSPALIVGLGNPGAEYAGHRHNIGFRVVDALAQAHGLRFARLRGTSAHVARGDVCGRPVALAKPQTFMNESGRAVGRVSQVCGVAPSQVLVVLDDLDLPLGRLRLRPDGGSAGHKGMRSIIERLGTQAFPRLRVGIDRPPGRMDPAEYVLLPFAEQELVVVRQVLDHAVSAIECWLAEGIDVAMGRYNPPAPGTGRGQEAGVGPGDAGPSTGEGAQS